MLFFTVTAQAQKSTTAHDERPMDIARKLGVPVRAFLLANKAIPRITKAAKLLKNTELVVPCLGGDVCARCGFGGTLLMCDAAGCASAWHPEGVGLAALPPDGADWVCPYTWQHTAPVRAPVSSAAAGGGTHREV